MCLLFDGRVSFSLVALAVVNSFVHVVMYSYYLASALRLRPPIWWKKQITRLQITQFSVGVIGGTYYYALDHAYGCAGGEPWTVLIGYVTNAALLFMFVQFYRAEYRHRKRE